MPKTIALAFSDLHLHKFQQFNTDNSRLKVSLRVLKIISNKAKKLKVPVIFTGDLFHNPKEVENETMSLALKTYKKYFEDRGIYFYAISGNHDMSEKNGLNHQSPSHLDSFAHFRTFVNCDRKTYVGQNFTLYGIPFMDNPNDLKTSIALIKKIPKQETPTILAIHTDLPGAMTPLGFEVESEIKMGLFAKFDLVLSGHIHKPQKLGKNIYMLGSPCHQDQGDCETLMGYWEVKDNNTAIFMELDLPKFIKLGKNEEPENDGNYYIPYGEVLAEEDVEQGEFNITIARDKLAKRYLALKKVKSKSKKRALVEILNQVQ